MNTLTTRIAAGLAGLTVAGIVGVMAHRPPVVTVTATPASSTEPVAVEELSPAELNAYTVDLPAAEAPVAAPVPAQPAQPAQAAPAAPKPAPRITWPTPAHGGVPIPQDSGDEQVWYRNADGYCGSTNRANLGDRTPDPTCPDNKPATYRDPATEDKPVYVMGADGFCSGMAQRDAAAAGYPDGDPRCKQGGYGSTPQPSGQ